MNDFIFGVGTGVLIVFIIEFVAYMIHEKKNKKKSEEMEKATAEFNKLDLDVYDKPVSASIPHKVMSPMPKPLKMVLSKDGGITHSKNCRCNTCEDNQEK